MLLLQFLKFDFYLDMGEHRGQCQYQHSISFRCIFWQFIYFSKLASPLKEQERNLIEKQATKYKKSICRLSFHSLRNKNNRKKSIQPALRNIFYAAIHKISSFIVFFFLILMQKMCENYCEIPTEVSKNKEDMGHFNKDVNGSHWLQNL